MTLRCNCANRPSQCHITRKLAERARSNRPLPKTSRGSACRAASAQCGSRTKIPRAPIAPPACRRSKSSRCRNRPGTASLHTCTIERHPGDQVDISDERVRLRRRRVDRNEAVRENVESYLPFRLVKEIKVKLLSSEFNPPSGIKKDYLNHFNVGGSVPFQVSDARSIRFKE